MHKYFKYTYQKSGARQMAQQAVKRICSSSKGLKFISQHPHGREQAGTPVSGLLIPSSGLLRFLHTCGTQRHTSSHTNTFLKKQQQQNSREH